MTKYCYRCKTCGAALEREFPLGEAPSLVSGTHAMPFSAEHADEMEIVRLCDGEAGRDYRAEGMRFNDFWFMAHMQSDLVAPELKGAGVNSKAFRDYNDKTYSPREHMPTLPPNVKAIYKERYGKKEEARAGDSLRLDCD